MDVREIVGSSLNMIQRKASKHDTKKNNPIMTERNNPEHDRERKESGGKNLSVAVLTKLPVLKNFGNGRFQILVLAGFNDFDNLDFLFIQTAVNADGIVILLGTVIEFGCLQAIALRIVILRRITSIAPIIIKKIIYTAYDGIIVNLKTRYPATHKTIAITIAIAILKNAFRLPLSAPYSSSQSSFGCVESRSTPVYVQMPEPRIPSTT